MCVTFHGQDDSTCLALLTTWMGCFLAGVVWQTCTDIIYKERSYRNGYQEI
jgi:hypothetical protein